jgi:diacylglycerol kinase
VACNLAIELAGLTNRECGLVDLSLELGDVGCCFDTQPIYTVSDLCRDGVDLDRSMLERGFHKLPSNVCILVRPHRVEEAYEVTPEGVSAMLTEARSLYPFVVVDLPRTFSTVAAAALTMAVAAVIVSEIINTAIETIIDLISPGYHPLAGLAKNLAAAAVVVAALFAALVGAVILGPPLWGKLAGGR